MLQGYSYKLWELNFSIIENESVVLAAGFKKAEELCLNFEENISYQKNTDFENILNRYQNGDINALKDFKYQINGTKFQNTIWKQLTHIPAGSTWTYQQVAQRAAHPKAIRAAGSTCGKNNICLIIPCHRVIKSNGEIGKYYYGSNLKQRLLNHEKNFGKSKE